MTLTCFKSYDVRGRLGVDIDASVARRIGLGFARVLRPAEVVVGRDVRTSGTELSAALVEGLRAEGVDVIDIGLCGSEEVYFATGRLKAGGGIMVTASHNPIDYNGMKLVGPSSRPLDPETEFNDIRLAAEAAGEAVPGGDEGSYTYHDMRLHYASAVADFVDAAALAPLKVLVNAGNGTAGPAFDAIADELAKRGSPLTFIRHFWEADGTFPNGIPNPLLPENRGVTEDAVRAAGADLGVAWDGDFDRCFFFDQTGGFVDGEYVVALLARAALNDEPEATIVHDPRVVWATQDIVKAAGGSAAVSKVGHAFMKAQMRRTRAVYGGEMSAHHYFRDFYYCDTGMIPWLKVVQQMSRAGKPLSELVADLKARFPSSGEINFRVVDPAAEIAALRDLLGPDAQEVDELDGVSLTFADWRMNLRASNTEPLLRLNVETRGDADLLSEKVKFIEGHLSGSAAGKGN